MQVLQEIKKIRGTHSKLVFEMLNEQYVYLLVLHFVILTSLCALCLQCLKKIGIYRNLAHLLPNSVTPVKVILVSKEGITPL